jgi:hypothetical protein
MPGRGEGEETRQTAEDSGGAEAINLGVLRFEDSDLTEAAAIFLVVEPLDESRDVPQGSPRGRRRFELTAEGLEAHLEAPGVVRWERPELPSVAIGVLGSTGTGKTTLLHALEREAERDTPVQIDDAYYDEVGKAVGRGTPSVLLGTSTRSLKRHLTKLKDSHEDQ